MTVLMANLVVLLPTLAVAWLSGRGPALLGAAIGNAFGLVNLGALAWSVARFINKASSGRRAVYAGAIAGKLLVMFGAIYVFVVVLELHTVGFALGYTALVLALVVGGLIMANRATRV